MPPTKVMTGKYRRKRQPKAITRAEAVAFIKSGSRGRIFAVEFTKRTNGERRYMVARYGVRAYVKGVGLSFDPAAKQLIVVWDVQLKNYRMVNIPGITGLMVKGEYFLVRG